MPNYKYAEIESRTRLSLRMFRQTEERINDFLNYVPLSHNHLKVYSPKLISIILEIGPELLNSFDLAITKTGIYSTSEMLDSSLRQDRKNLWKKERELRKKKKSLTFKDYYCFLDDHGVPKLSKATIQIKDFDSYVTPFEGLNSDWWESYNQLRHDKYNNLRKATLRTALKASAALFWIVENNVRFFSFEKPFVSNLFSTIEPYNIDPPLKRV